MVEAQKYSGIHYLVNHIICFTCCYFLVFTLVFMETSLVGKHHV